MNRSTYSMVTGVMLLLATSVAAGPVCKADRDVCAEAIRRHLSERPSLGVTLSGSRWGTVVVSVVPGSPAARAGLRADDRIVAINGHDCGGADPEEVKQILVSEGKKDPWVTIVVGRPGEFRRIRAKFDTLSEEQVEAIVERHLRTAHAD